jgi:hypothetical protein
LIPLVKCIWSLMLPYVTLTTHWCFIFHNIYSYQSIYKPVNFMMTFDYSLLKVLSNLYEILRS